MKVCICPIVKQIWLLSFCINVSIDLIFHEHNILPLTTSMHLLLKNSLGSEYFWKWYVECCTFARNNNRCKNWYFAEHWYYLLKGKKFRCRDSNPFILRPWTARLPSQPTFTYNYIQILVNEIWTRDNDY